MFHPVTASTYFMIGCTDIPWEHREDGYVDKEL
jgi:hypothetical protein